MPFEFANDEDPELNSDDFENQESGEMEMNEAEMKAELERLRAQNAYLRTKKKAQSLSR